MVLVAEVELAQLEPTAIVQMVVQEVLESHQVILALLFIIVVAAAAAHILEQVALVVWVVAVPVQLLKMLIIPLLVELILVVVQVVWQVTEVS
jgi:hypothetical protein